MTLQAARPHDFTVQEVLNRVFDSTNNRLNTNIAALLAQANTWTAAQTFGDKLVIDNPSGTSGANEWLDVRGDVTDNNNYPIIQLSGGTLGTSHYPQIRLGNGGLQMQIYSGRATVGNRMQILLHGNTAGNAQTRFQKNDGTTTTDLMTLLDTGTLDMNDNAINNIAAAGNDFGAAQLDLAAGYTVLGADTLILDVTAGNIGLGGDPTGTGFVQILTPATSGTPGATGVSIRQRTIGTFTDTNTAASGTASKVIVNSFTAGQIAASNANVTITDAATMYLGSAPTAGANMTLTNAYSLWVTEAARLDGAVFINDTDDGDVTTGLTINQGASDDSILALKSSDVTHGRLAVAETDTYGSFSKANATQGGLKIRGLAETAAGIALALDGYFGTPNTTKTTAGRGIIEFVEYQHDGSNNLENTDANANLVGIRTYIGDATTTRFLFDAEGSGHADVEWVAFDSHNDLALMDAMQSEMTGRMTPPRYGENSLYYDKGYLEETGIIGKDSWHLEHREGDVVQLRSMVNFTKLAMLHHGAILQIGDAMKALAAENRELKALIGGQ